MGFDIAFDADWWARHWWLMFPIFGFIVAFYSMWLQHRRSRDWLALMRTYAEQGKEPPASLANLASSGDMRWGAASSHYWRRSPLLDVRRAIFMGVLSGAFAYLYYHDPIRNDGFGIAAVILGALALGYLLMAPFRSKSDDTPSAPPKSNGS